MTCIVIKDVFALTISSLAFSLCSTFYYIIYNNIYYIYIFFFKSPGVSNCICVCVRAAGCFGRQHWPLCHVDEAVRGETYNLSLYP